MTQTSPMSGESSSLRHVFQSAETALYRDLRLALVLWNGIVGGAEHFTAELAHAMRSMGADARVVFVGHAQPLSGRLDMLGVPFDALGVDRGRAVLKHPRRFARLVKSDGADGVLLISSGYLAAALWTGGYRGRVVAVEHGALLQVNRLNPYQRLIRRMDRASGSWSCDVEVAVSDYMLREILLHRHARRVVRIYNGVDLDRFRPKSDDEDSAQEKRRGCVIGWGGRLISGKAVDNLVRAFARMADTGNHILQIAGDGPERGRLESLARALGVANSVEFLGWVQDMPSFWRDCDVAAVTSNGWIESFCLGAVEPMASGKPVVATKSGALPEIIGDGRTGLLVAPGDIEGFGKALERYAVDTTLRRSHGAQARRACEERFDLKKCAAAYLDLYATR